MTFAVENETYMECVWLGEISATQRKYERLFSHLCYNILAAEVPILYQEIKIWGSIINSFIEWKEAKVLQEYFDKIPTSLLKRTVQNSIENPLDIDRGQTWMEGFCSLFSSEGFIDHMGTVD